MMPGPAISVKSFFGREVGTGSNAGTGRAGAEGNRMAYGDAAEEGAR
jgi:hypothetical protein